MINSLVNRQILPIVLLLIQSGVILPAALAQGVDTDTDPPSVERIDGALSESDSAEVSVQVVDPHGTPIEGADLRWMRELPPEEESEGNSSSVSFSLRSPPIDCRSGMVPNEWYSFAYDPELRSYSVKLPMPLPCLEEIRVWIRNPGFVTVGPMRSNGYGKPDSRLISYTMYRGISGDRAPYDEEMMSYDYYARLILVPIPDEGINDVWRPLDSHPDVVKIDRFSLSDGSQMFLVYLSRDLLPMNDPLLRDLQSEPRTGEANALFIWQPDGVSLPITRRLSTYRWTWPIPQTFTVRSKDRESVDSLATLHGAKVSDFAGVFRISFPPGTGQTALIAAEAFGVTFGPDAVKIEKGGQGR